MVPKSKWKWQFHLEWRVSSDYRRELVSEKQTFIVIKIKDNKFSKIKK